MSPGGEKILCRVKNHNMGGRYRVGPVVWCPLSLLQISEFSLFYCSFEFLNSVLGKSFLTKVKRISFRLKEMQI